MAVMMARQLSVDKRLKDVDLELNPAEMVGLIGPNGAGKSTLLNAMAGIQTYQGQVFIDGENIDNLPARQRARKIALQPQFINSAWSLCVHDIVSFGRIPWGDTDQGIIHQAMQQANVEQLSQRRVDELSGGEKARVWLARMLANQADVLLMDEPVANLDIHYQQEVLNILSAYSRQQHAVMIAIHDLSLAARYCDKIYLMDRSRVIKSGPASEVLTKDLLSEVFQVDIHVDLGAEPPVVLAG